jgi:hypothetical protein
MWGREMGHGLILLRLLRTVARLVLLVAVLIAGMAAVPVDNQQQAAPQELYQMRFPLAGPRSFTDTFGAPRDGGRLHRGVDIFAEKLTPVVAVADGTVRNVSTGERAGRYIVLEHTDGWSSYYLHLNNDSPGTDDGLQDERVPGIVVGARVAAGDPLDYVGDSGNAEETPSHLHFELHNPDGEAINPYPHLLAAEAAPDAQVEQALLGASDPLRAPGGTEVIGHFDPGDGFAAGLWVNDDVAYLGTWGRAGACPATGVRMLDVADPVVPELIGVVASGDEFPETDTDSVWVGEIATDSFTGTIAVAAVSLCDNSERNRQTDSFRGLAIYDVTVPSDARLLGVHHTGEQTQGVHDVDVAVRADGTVLVAATVMQSLLHSELLGDLRLVDITDPANPVETADWDFRSDVTQEERDQLPAGIDEGQLHAHSVSFAADGQRLWVANWDAGAVLLNVGDSALPLRTNWVNQLSSAEGNVHSVVSYAEGGVIIVSSEDLYPTGTKDHEPGWGQQAVLDLTGSPLSRLVPGGAATDADRAVPLDGYHSAHNAVLEGNLLYTSWYSSGVRIVDIAQPAEPVEIGYFVPPPTIDPQGYWVAPNGSRSFAMVWDVSVVDDLIYLSDMNSGLWIIRYVGDNPAPTNRSSSAELAYVR